MKSKFYLQTEARGFRRRALQRALKGTAQATAPFSLELLIVDEEEIKRLNREHRAVDKVTDVLSFPSMDGIKGTPVLHEEHVDVLDEKGRIFLGSIVICEKRAREQAEEYGHSFARELNYLAVHGVLHCLGYDHETEEEKAEMRAEEEKILSRMKLTRQTRRTT